MKLRKTGGRRRKGVKERAKANGVSLTECALGFFHTDHPEIAAHMLKARASVGDQCHGGV